MQSDAYDEMIALQGTHWWFVARRRIIRMVAAKYLPVGTGKVLEVGCGVGGNVVVLSKFGKYVGLDIHAPAIEYCIKSHPGKMFINSSIEDIQKVKEIEKYNSIFILDVLEHLDRDVESLRRLGKLLDDGGKFLITVPAFQFLWSTHDEFVHHKRRYTKKNLINTLHSAGLEIERISYFNTFLFPLAFIQRTMLKLLNRTSKTHLNQPPKFANAILQFIFSLEVPVLRKLSLPVGLSLFAVCHKKEV